MVTDRDDGRLLAAVIVAAGLIVGVVAWAGARDRAGVEVVTSRSAHPPLVLPEVAPAPVEGDLAWHGWRHDLFWQALAAEPEPEVEVSSIAVERRPSGEVVVTNPPEVPVAADDEVRAIICAGRTWDCDTALRVVRCESTFRADAVGGAGERGWWQIHPVHRPRLGATWDLLFDPVVNTDVAYRMRREQGWRPWTCARGAR